MEPRLGRRGNTVSRASGRPSSCFNGAPAWSPGKHVDLAAQRLAVIASMEPRLGRRGNTVRLNLNVSFTSASMEPRLGRRGNPNTGRMPARSNAASMEPRLGRRGNEEVPMETTTYHLLQWSPGLVAGETRQGDQRLPTRNRASMEPRLGRRGNTVFDRCQGWRGKASMEPRLGRRGNSKSKRRKITVHKLQWSPGLVAGET